MIKRVLGNILCKGQGHVMYFLVDAYSPKPLDVVTSHLRRCIGHMMWRVLGYILCDLDPKVKVKGKKVGICDHGMVYHRLLL